MNEIAKRFFSFFLALLLLLSQSMRRWDSWGLFKCGWNERGHNNKELFSIFNSYLSRQKDEHILHWLIVCRSYRLIKTKIIPFRLFPLSAQWDPNIPCTRTQDYQNSTNSFRYSPVVVRLLLSLGMNNNLRVNLNQWKCLRMKERKRNSQWWRRWVQYTDL